MAEAPIVTDVAPDGRATVTLNRPRVHNAFDEDMISRLATALGAVADDPGVRVVVLAAQGKSFSAGADLTWMKRTAGYTAAENLADAEALAGLMAALDRLPKPTVARVQGDAFGGGVGLIACCDIAVAAEGARFALSEVKLGLVPAVISPYVVAAIGERQARRYMLSAERFDAAEARRTGLVHEVVAAGALDGAVSALVRALRANGPAAMAEVKELVRAVSRRPLDDKLARETAARIARVRASDEGREGLAAFLEKRKPGWTED